MRHRDIFFGMKAKVTYILLLIALSLVTYPSFGVQDHRRIHAFEINEPKRVQDNPVQKLKTTREESYNPSDDHELPISPEDISLGSENGTIEGHSSGRSLPLVMKNRKSPTRCDVIRRSSKWSDTCANASGSKEPIPLLITGIGRSGTTYLMQLLSALGLNVAHDSQESCPDQKVRANVTR